MTDTVFTNRTISKIIAVIGTRRFYDALFTLLERVIKIDQCVILQLDKNNDQSWLLCRNLHNKHIVNTAAKSYVEAGFKSDSNLNIFRSIKPNEVKLLYFDDLVAKMDPAYRDQYFDELGLIDKVSIITASNDYRYYINLYRGKGRDPFYNEQIFKQDSLDLVIASLITRHYELNHSLREEGSLAFLTERERDVCKRILQARKAKQIAHELSISVNTVVTYRKRAYAKLGINSRRALFALCEGN